MHSVDYMLSQDIHLSVCPSVTRRYFVEMGKDTAIVTMEGE